MTKSVNASPVASHDAEWRTSSYTAGDSACVEVSRRFSGPVVAVRDTKDRAAGHTTISPDAWAAFISAAKGGTFDEPFTA
ncbi:DUF397 domain-containing protein [Streptomyces triticirhizae]|uniref:DUF397 domain-containing protein n=1 Tax=Streptomyces triticirhizae TaxID=2483353 RepID=A0A3M2LZG5_9ACTN|nr:DUF397 domain-containing protein [Streptomyces triticirhizae]RMI42859.1 DUF397 domain-containing protein [Streptomyces triticirhizae]